ncbi:MAG: metal-dependent hydrolase [Saprospiraceae bacterium]
MGTLLAVGFKGSPGPLHHLGITFFWSILTHPILDCFTNWGTQIWQPFLDTRVQWTTVSVVDPIYTVPFGLLVLLASWLHRSSKVRFYLNWAGILWGCAYLAYTYWHKTIVNEAFEKTLQANEINYRKYQTGPSIFNNIVWYGVAEGDTAYYFSMYGFNDKNPGFTGISTLPKNYELASHIPDDSRAMKFIHWFTSDYYNFIPRGPDTLQVNDLRFGLLGDTLVDNNYVFQFFLFKNEKGEWDLQQNRGAQEDTEAGKKAMGTLWKRVKGLD